MTKHEAQAQCLGIMVHVAVQMLRDAGHVEAADSLAMRSNNVLDGRGLQAEGYVEVADGCWLSKQSVFELAASMGVGDA